MKTRTELHLSKAPYQISYADKILMIGSCFTEHIGNKLTELKYDVVTNPLGIMYHPIPLHKTITDTINKIKIVAQDLILNPDGQYVHWNVHSSISSIDVSETVDLIQSRREMLLKTLQSAKYLIISYGSAYVYEHHTNGPVASCHKFGAEKFTKKLSSIKNLRSSFDQFCLLLASHFPHISILLTVSPVRHIRDGIIENNRSKAHLLSMVHDVCDSYYHIHYLPSYELLIDDLRDYRYYTEDMVHPSDTAIKYIWNKISNHILDTKDHQLRMNIFKIVQAAHHRPVNPNSDKHKMFCSKQMDDINTILKKHPHMNFGRELELLLK